MFRSSVARALFGGLVCSAIGCATARGAKTGQSPDVAISIAEENARIGDEAFPIGDSAALRAGLGGACSSGCTYVEMQPTPQATYTAIRAVYEAARRTDAQKLGLRFAWKSTVGLLRLGDMATDAPCATEVIGVENAMYVYVDGRVLPPTHECDDWSATVCRGAESGSASYEWSQLARVVERYPEKFRRGVCIDLRGSARATVLEQVVSTIDAASEEPTTYVLTTGKKAGELPNEEISRVVNGATEDLGACFRKHPTSAPVGATVRFVIHSDGSVARAGVVESEGADATLKACLVDVVTGLRFPRPTNGGNVVINYPLEFTPR